MEKQIIISVSREYGSDGHQIAKRLAGNLGINYYDRSIIEDIAEANNISTEHLKKYDEKPRKLFLSRRVGSHTNSMEEIVAEMQFEYLKEKADSGESFIIVGRCSETVLRDREGLIAIFVLGDLNDKVKRIQEKHQISQPEAIQKIRRHDWYRKHYHNRHSSGRWGDSRYYDICINSSRLGVEKTAELLTYFVKERIEKI